MENKKAAHWKVQWQPGSGGRATVICMNAAIKLTRLEYAPLRVFFVGQRGECVTWNEIPAQAAYSLYVPGIKKKLLICTRITQKFADPLHREFNCHEFYLETNGGRLFYVSFAVLNDMN